MSTPDTDESPRSLHRTSFGNDFVSELPGDPELKNFNRQVTGAFYSLVEPTPTKSPRLLAWSESLAAQFGFSKPDAEDVKLLSGNLVTPSMQPYAAAYGGHQFGNWAGQLGDGRAITLGEVTDLKSRPWELQLKGAGPTPYSRRADGRAVLRSSLREYICSEAMFHLGVPTTRALSLVATGDSVVRDMFYDGHPDREPGAITARMAPTFIRFGNFEIFAARHDLENLRRLADYVIEKHDPDLKSFGERTYVEFFRRVCERTVRMGVDWMRLGFVHGVMNTDNMSILGLTIDYGPYGWLDNYDPTWTPNTTDLPGRRYCYGHQPGILIWNLIRLANALVELSPDIIQEFETVLREAENLYGDLYLKAMSAKLGLSALDPAKDLSVLEELDALLTAAETDLTLFYRGLATFPMDVAPTGLPEFLKASFYDVSRVDAQLENRWMAFLIDLQKRVRADGVDPAERTSSMKKVNPIYVPRNYLAQECIDAATAGDTRLLEEFMEVLKRPFEEQAGADRFAAKRPDWARTKAGCSTLSCSS